MNLKMNLKQIREKCEIIKFGKILSNNERIISHYAHKFQPALYFFQNKEMLNYDDQTELIIAWSGFTDKEKYEYELYSLEYNYHDIYREIIKLL